MPERRIPHSQMRGHWPCGLVLTILLALQIHAAFSAEWSKLKTCSDLGFCRRHRHFAAEPAARYAIDASSVVLQAWREHPALRATVRSSDGPDLVLVIIAFAHGVFRVVLDDLEEPKHPRHFVPDVILEHAKPLDLSDSHFSVSETGLTVQHPDAASSSKLVVDFKPFKVDLYSGSSDTAQVSLNGQSKLLIDTFEPCGKPGQCSSQDNQSGEGQASSSNEESQQTEKSSDEVANDKSESASEADAATEAVTPAAEAATPAAPVCDGCGSEQFKEHTDPKLRGPESVGMDVSFPSAAHIYGIPERTMSFSLDDTVSAEGEATSEPYRLYNLDVFEFELDKPLGLYGSIPFIHARNKKQSVGMVWLNSAETYIDVTSMKTGKTTHWFSETGAVDVFLLPGPSASAVQGQYMFLTGTPAMPQRFALGYHQCRWNYRDEPDARGVDADFDKHDIPYDVLWLDIEHTDGKRYFTWDTERFPNPTALQEHIAARGRKMVTIVDPHVKRDKKYSVHQMGTDENLYVKNPDGKDYDGWCWPGSSSYFDVTMPRAREMFGGMFHPTKYPHFSKNLHIWNDMNEPSVFNGPEGTMQKDRMHHGNVEHRHVHNIYGHYFMQATFDGVRTGHGGDNRPFVLSRSFFAGSQRFGAIWTGDNTADWDHLASSVRMLLPLQISAMVFSGADVGGFFGNPSPDLLTRWYQVGAFQPFFRGHAHLDTNRREPWVFGEPYTSPIATAIRTRYQFLPLWYTLMAENHMWDKLSSFVKSAGPPMRPMWWEFPNDSRSDSIQTQWMVGDALLVAPVMEKDAQTHTFYVPEGERWYDLFAPNARGNPLEGFGDVKLSVTLDRMIVLQRGGSIIPTQERRRRSSVSMSKDPYTLLVALDIDRQATGQLYLDDGESYGFEKDVFRFRKFKFADGKLRSSTAAGSGGQFDIFSSVIERVIIFGYGPKPPRAVQSGGRQVEFQHIASTGTLTLQRLQLSAANVDWEVVIDN